MGSLMSGDSDRVVVGRRGRRRIPEARISNFVKGKNGSGLMFSYQATYGGPQRTWKAVEQSSSGTISVTASGIQAFSLFIVQGVYPLFIPLLFSFRFVSIVGSS